MALWTAAPTWPACPVLPDPATAGGEWTVDLLVLQLLLDLFVGLELHLLRLTLVFFVTVSETAHTHTAGGGPQASGRGRAIGGLCSSSRSLWRTEGCAGRQVVVGLGSKLPSPLAGAKGAVGRGRPELES